MNSTDKRFVETFNLFETRRAMRRAMREARTALCTGPHVEQVRKLTTQELDRFMQRRIERDSEQHVRTLKHVAGWKKKLPMPVFACENTEFDCGEAGHAEGKCGNAQCLGRVKVRLS